MLTKPVGIYLNWSSYDELSDNVELTEELALRQLHELVRLRSFGVQIDYYVMDAFWFDKDGGYRKWRKPHWENGPQKWLEMCKENSIKPGMWFGANNPAWMNPISEWMQSFDPQTGCMSCFYGGFLPHYIETLQHWYEQGVRLFKFDFADFSAAPPGIKESLLPSEIRQANVIAFRGALKAFKQQHPDVLLLAYNGFEERTIQNTTDEPIAKVIDTRWLELFDSIYCGDARPSDMPAMNFWRSKDIYSDHMLRLYRLNGIPLERIDNASFMIGTTGTCYFRGKEAWRGMLMLSLARGGWMNTYYGNLDLLSDEDAKWFAQVQKLYFEIQAKGRTEVLGDLPSSGKIYGYAGSSDAGVLLTLVNPAQESQSFELAYPGKARVLFRDKGFNPILEEGKITLGAEQLVVLGYGVYADCDFGIESDVEIPQSIEPLELAFDIENNVASTSFVPTVQGTIRIIFQQFNPQGRVVRTYVDGITHKTLGEKLKIEAQQGQNPLNLRINYDKAIWSGLSWAVGEITVENLEEAIQIRCSSLEKTPLVLKVSAYRLAY